MVLRRFGQVDLAVLNRLGDHLGLLVGLLDGERTASVFLLRSFESVFDTVDLAGFHFPLADHL